MKSILKLTGDKSSVALQNRGKHRQMSISLCLLFLIMFTTSCVQDWTDAPPSEGSATDREITLRVAVPSISPNESGQTRAIGAEQENSINTIQVLAFKVMTDAGGNILSESYDYSTTGSRSTSSNAGDGTQNFTAKVKVRAYKQRFVIITNADAAVKALTDYPDTWVGEAKTTMLEGLQVSLEEGNDRWNVISPSNYEAFPMWGESAVETISGETTNLSTGVPMLRMMAKIDVELDTSVAGLTEKFQLKSVHLYNTNRKGQVVPSSIQETSKDGKRYLYVDSPTIPSGATISKGPIAYTDFSSPGVPDVAMKGAIYTFEASANEDASKATCIVVGGMYQGKLNYYRVDFLKDDRKTYRDILRNHQYTVNITNVKGPGEGTPEEAFNVKSVNIETSILSWNNGGIGNWIFGEHYSLGVRHTEIILSRRAQQTAQYVTTNYPVTLSYPQRWDYKLTATVDIASNAPTWIRFHSRTNKGVGETDELLLEADKYDGTTERVAYLHVSAGSFTLVTKIIQNNTLPFSLQLKPTADILFESGVMLASGVEITPDTLKILWAPEEINATYRILPVNEGGITFMQPSGVGTTSTEISGGDMKLVLQPKKFTDAEVSGNPWLEKVSQIEVTASNNLGEKISQVVNVRQKSYGVVTTTQTEAYVMEGQQNSIKVKANAPWKAELVSGGTAIETITSSTGAGNTISGEDITFTMKNAPNYFHGTSYVKISSPDGKFKEVTVKIDGVRYLYDTALGDVWEVAKETQTAVKWWRADTSCPKGYIIPTPNVVTLWRQTGIELPESKIWVDDIPGSTTIYLTVDKTRKMISGTIGLVTFDKINGLNYIAYTGDIHSMAPWGDVTNAIAAMDNGYMNSVGHRIMFYAENLPVLSGHWPLCIRLKGHADTSYVPLTNIDKTANIRCVKKVL